MALFASVRSQLESPTDMCWLAGSCLARLGSYLENPKRVQASQVTILSQKEA